MTRRHAGSLVVVGVLAVVLLTLAGCGGGNGNDAVRGGARSTPSTSGSSGAAAYVGLTKKAATAKADAAGTPWRITREDGESFPVTQDYNPDRLNFEIDEGTVTKATYG